MAPFGRTRQAQPQPRAQASQHAKGGDGHLALLEEERAWVSRIRSGDETAFQELFRRYYDPLCRFVETYVRRPDLAEEVVQSLFLRLWVRREDWRLQETLRTYLFTAARNASLNHLAHERLFRVFLLRTGHSADALPGGSSSEGEARVSQDEVEIAVRRAIAALPRRYAPVLALRWEHEMTYAEIARVMRLPPKTVETRAARAIQMLRPALRRLI